MVPKLREWLQLGRIHTASLTIPGTLLGLVAAPPHTPTDFILFGIWALFFHYVGFSDNGIQDLAWDARDESKRHFVLVTGAVSLGTARVVFFFGTMLLWYTGLALAWSHARGLGALFTLVFLTTAIVNGVAYNRLCKKSLWAPLFISASFASLPAFAYFASGGTPGFGVWSYVMLYGFALMMCQIGWSGYYKDLKSDPVSLLRRLGVTATQADLLDRVFYGVPLRAGFVGLALRVLCPLLAFLWSPTWPVLVLGLLTVLSFEPLLRSRTAPRASQVRWMGVSEILAYWTLLASVEPLLGSWLAFTAWALLPLGWYVVWNKALWNTSLAPRV